MDKFYPFITSSFGAGLAMSWLGNSLYSSCPLGRYCLESEIVEVVQFDIRSYHD